MSMNFDKFIETTKICPIQASPYEIAWHINDVKTVLEWLRNQEQIVLGGDIIDYQKKYTYDNWFYNYNSLVSLCQNTNDSIDKALEFISEYLKINGDKYYVILVLR